MTERDDGEFVLVYFEEENKYDVVSDVYIEELCDSAAPLAVGAMVHVLWQDRGAFPAVVMGLSVNVRKVLEEGPKFSSAVRSLELISLVMSKAGKTGSALAFFLPHQRPVTPVEWLTSPAPLILYFQRALVAQVQSTIKSSE
ncbi:hypothetical protein HPB47_008686 [Ixodes persulcatus]|uniref:Uncharacterized protein n=1 Tax=Ixodes persulcatus TaxID=34615 RepID=A0AC60P436_IXOPE|nr:hypothetical protein HPB47_008686 [Ixodes persulcatus]